MVDNRNTITDGWKEKIGGKKVLLLVTSVSSLLSFEEKRISMMMTIFDRVRTLENVVLWWRPHPLELSTIGSMRPKLKEAYMNAKQYFVENNIGILDESGDPDRAMAVADAYLGDGGSMCHLFKITGKPVFIINYSVSETDTSIILRVSDFCVKDGLMYCVSAFYNCLFVMDIDSFNVLKLIKIPYNYPLLYVKVYTLFLSDTILYIYNGKDIFSYDIETEEFKKYSPDTFDYEKLISALGEDEKIISKYLHSSSEEDLAHNRLLKTYLSVNRIADTGRLRGIAKCCGKYVLISTLDKQIAVYDPATRKKTCITDIPNDFEWKGAASFADIVVDGECVLLFPTNSNMIIEININRYTAKKYEPFDTQRYNIHSLCAQKIGEKLYLFPVESNNAIVIDTSSGEINEKVISLSEELQQILLDENILKPRENIPGEQFFLSENFRYCSIYKFIDSFNEYEITGSQHIICSDIGKNIHKTIKKDLLDN